MKQNTVDNIYMDELDMRDEVSTRPASSEELEPVQLGDHPEHLVYIRSKLAEGIRSPLIHFLEQNMEVLAWKQEDMGGVDPAVITHRLNVNPSFKSVKQKRRSFAQKDKRRLMKRSVSSSKKRQSEKWNTLNGWLTLFSLKKQTASGSFA